MAKRGRKTRGKTGYMISAVAEMYDIHPQTLRLYEREGLLIPSRSNGNTRLYAPDDLERLETILNLTRDLGVNLAGIEIILNMRDRMRRMQDEMQAFVDFVQQDFLERSEKARPGTQNALVRITPPQIVRTRGGASK
jgi:MerR family transcriptional regulator/heat shock protein HspR